MSGTSERPRDPVPVACRLDAFDTAERRRYDAVRADLLGHVRAVDELEAGFRLTLDADPSVAALAGEWIALERRCCPFLAFTLRSSAADGTELIVAGPAGAKEILRPALETRRSQKSH